MSLQKYFSSKQNTRTGQKGRNPDLLQRRDQKLAYRFYYHAQLRGLSYSDTLKVLSEEFDLCERVVVDRLRANQQLVDELFASRPTATRLRRAYPFYTW
ncbi:hypothetical protein [Tenuifilum osseticum]|uniref:hypothetical protein n=1 Tax=Tenuifilum TaxID=2760873 RepID=UPI0030A9C03C